jgi:hypothetical protein
LAVSVATIKQWQAQSVGKPSRAAEQKSILVLFIFGANNGVGCEKEKEAQGEEARFHRGMNSRIAE